MKYDEVKNEIAKIGKTMLSHGWTELQVENALLDAIDDYIEELAQLEPRNDGGEWW